jgi:predicted nucleotidyltransferase
MDLPDSVLEDITWRLAEARGVAAVVLGGSRAKGSARAESDYDLGLYYESEHPLDIHRLLDVVKNLVDDPGAAAVTPIGGWGPWIVGGGWLRVQGRKFDILYRNIEAVAQTIGECREGRVTMNYQAGHPHGFCSAIWMGEVALCRPLQDPKGKIAALKAMTSPYPEALRRSLVEKFGWEILFSIENGEIAIARGDRTHVAGCAYRALCCVGQVLFAVNRRYLINEKAALPQAALFPRTVSGLAEAVEDVWAAIGVGAFARAFATMRMLERDLQIVAAATA